MVLHHPLFKQVDQALKQICPALLCMLLILMSSSATAAETDETHDVTLETIVVTAAGYEQKIADAPASISVITQTDLQRRPYVTLLDALRDVEGVDVGETRDKTGKGTISIRGMGSAYTLILINGRRQNNNGDIYPNSFGGNQFNHIPPLDAIERIEVIRGPMSTLYGADALGGVINIITKKTTDTWHGSATFGHTFQENSELGDNQTMDISLMGPIWPGKLSLALRGSHYTRDASTPEYDVKYDPNGVAHQREAGFGGGGRTVANTNWSVGGTLTFTPTDDQDIIFDIDTSRQKYDNDKSQLGTLDSYDRLLYFSNAGVQPRTGYNSNQRFERDQWAVTHNGRWGVGNTSFSVSRVDTANKGRTLPLTADERQFMLDLTTAVGPNLGWTQVSGTDYYRPRSTSAWNAMSESDKLAAIEAGGLSADQYAELMSLLPRRERVLETREYTFDLKYDMVLFDQHMLVVGGQMINGEMEDGVFGMTGTGGYESGTTQDQKMWSLFMEDSWHLFDGFTLTGGIRYDHHNEFGGQASPRGYAVWNFIPTMTIKGGVSTGYKTPNTSDLFDGIIGFGGQGTSPWMGNPDLEPETSINYELAYYYDHAAGHNFNVTGFYNRFKDKIMSGETVAADFGPEWELLGYSTYSQKKNVARADIKGVEVAGKVMLPFDLSLKANYTYMESEQKGGSEEGQPLSGNAKHMANATLSWMPLDTLNVYFESEYRSKRYRSWDSTANKALYYKEYTIFHLGATYDVNTYITVNARVNNLFDKDFTTYTTSWTLSGGEYTATYTDDYNLAAQGRNFWVGINCRF
ncbi:TonB-dependent receptor [Desulfosarcina sp. OttesenSCG-928-A07]|nr:TonB-dependent receptor [Desulfosarcina sp. OttesenSCG-928-A07]